MMDDYFSDVSEYSSDSEDEIDPPEVWCERELDYWRLEDVMDSRPPPPVVEYVQNIGLFNIRECVVGPIVVDPRQVMDSISANNWHAFWTHGRENKDANLRFDDLDAIGEFCMLLCEACYEVVIPTRIRSCMLRILAHGRFV